MNTEQLLTYLQNTKELTEQTLPETQKLTEEFPWFQLGWILYLKNLKNINSPDYEQVLKKVAVIVPERKNLFKFLNNELPQRKLSIDKLKAASSLYQLEGDVGAQESDSLIDRFLSKNTGAIGNVKGNQEVTGANDNKAFIEQSVAENDELITETLASIYFQQKNYEKAQKAYQKLSLKYPEKSVYFAARIKEIEVLKHNK